MAESKKSHKKILVVDDEPGIRLGIQWVLKEAGYEVAVASDADVGSKLLAESPVGLVITDIHMPESPLNGIEFMQSVQKRQPVPVILMTGHTDLLGPEQKNLQGAAGLLIKPFRSEALLNQVAEALGTPPPVLPNVAEFVFINIEELLARPTPLEFDLYARIRDEKILLVAKKGQPLDVGRIRDYIARGVSIFMRK